VRKGTKSFVSIVSLGLVVAGYQAGQAAEISSGFSAAAAPISGGTGATAGGSTSSGPSALGVTSAGSETLNTPAASATPAATSAAIPATSAGSSNTPAKVSTPAAVATPKSTPKATSSAPAPAPAASTAAPAPATTSSTKTGSAISYRYGTVQVSVTKANGKVTAVNLLQQGATGGRQGAFPYLVQYAIQANGTSFGNLGGATYTTDAFKQSLESALAKF
jgi:uncharacterized protein with FMN-binding domain